MFRGCVAPNHLFSGDQGAQAIPYSTQGLEIIHLVGVPGAGENSRPLEEVVQGTTFPVSPQSRT